MKVEIKCSQVVYYNQVVEMSKEDYQTLKDTDSDIMDTDPEFFLLEKYLDFSDVFDRNNELSDIDVFEYKEKKKDKPEGYF